MRDPIFIRYEKCPICGKKFTPAPRHAWRVGLRCDGKRVCSYTCMRKWEKANHVKNRDESARRVTK